MAQCLFHRSEGVDRRGVEERDVDLFLIPSIVHRVNTFGR